MEAIKGAEHLVCDCCEESTRRRRPKPVRLPGRYEFNYHLSLDVFYGKDVDRSLFAFLNVMCEAIRHFVGELGWASSLRSG